MGDWTIITDGGVSNRFDTEAEAVEDLRGGGYPAGSHVEFSPEPKGVFDVED